MLRKKIYTDVANATVTLLGLDGQGILVNNNLIITAAHCVEFSCEGEMALGDYYIEKIKAGKKELKVAPLAVEPVSDIAVLGSLLDGNQAIIDFEKFCEHTKPVPVCQNEFELFKEFKVHIYTHKGTWITGSAKQCGKNATQLQVETDEQIEGGTSGGPIINNYGELVGIVSNFITNRESPKTIGMAPRPHLTLPVWVCRQILE